MLSDFRVTSLSETDRNDTVINNERKSTFSFLYLRNCRVRPDIATNWVEQLWKAKTNAEICGKLKTRSLIGSSGCNLRARLSDRRLVSWLVNSGIWQRRNSEMSWRFLQCSGSEWFLVGFPIRRSIWPIAGEFLDRSKSVAWFYGWKCVVCFSREPRWLPTFYLFSFPHLPFLITRSITIETTQECTLSNRKRHCASKYNNIVLWILLLQNIYE